MHCATAVVGLSSPAALSDSGSDFTFLVQLHAGPLTRDDDDAAAVAVAAAAAATTPLHIAADAPKLRSCSSSGVLGGADVERSFGVGDQPGEVPSSFMMMSLSGGAAASSDSGSVASSLRTAATGGGEKGSAVSSAVPVPSTPVQIVKAVTMDSLRSTERPLHRQRVLGSTAGGANVVEVVVCGSGSGGGGGGDGGKESPAARSSSPTPPSPTLRTPLQPLPPHLGRDLARFAFKSYKQEPSDDELAFYAAALSTQRRQNAARPLAVPGATTGSHSVACELVYWGIVLPRAFVVDHGALAEGVMAIEQRAEEDVQDLARRTDPFVLLRQSAASYVPSCGELRRVGRHERLSSSTSGETANSSSEFPVQPAAEEATGGAAKLASDVSGASGSMRHVASYCSGITTLHPPAAPPPPLIISSSVCKGMLMPVFSHSLASLLYRPDARENNALIVPDADSRVFRKRREYYCVHDEPVLAAIAHQLLRGLSHLEDLPHAFKGRAFTGFAHNDLKLDNALVDKATGVVTICDFEFVSHVQGTSTVLHNSRVDKLPNSHMAPEGLGARSDVWSLGLLILELLVGIHPFIDGNAARDEFNEDCPLLCPRSDHVEGIDWKRNIRAHAMRCRAHVLQQLQEQEQQQQQQQQRQQQQQWAIQGRDGSAHVEQGTTAPAISPELDDFLDKCLSNDPGQRWSAAQLLKHPFVAQCGTGAEIRTTKEFVDRIMQARKSDTLLMMLLACPRVAEAQLSIDMSHSLGCGGNGGSVVYKAMLLGDRSPVDESSGAGGDNKSISSSSSTGGGHQGAPPANKRYDLAFKRLPHQRLIYDELSFIHTFVKARQTARALHRSVDPADGLLLPVALVINNIHSVDATRHKPYLTRIAGLLLRRLTGSLMRVMESPLTRSRSSSAVSTPRASPLVAPATPPCATPRCYAGGSGSSVRLAGSGLATPPVEHLVPLSLSSLSNNNSNATAPASSLMFNDEHSFNALDDIAVLRAIALLVTRSLCSLRGAPHQFAAVEYAGFSHNDLKLDNLLVDRLTGDVVLCDFELVGHIRQQQQPAAGSSSSPGEDGGCPPAAAAAAAPAAARGGGRAHRPNLSSERMTPCTHRAPEGCGPLSDVWGLGLAVLELALGTYPLLTGRGGASGFESHGGAAGECGADWSRNISAFAAQRSPLVASSAALASFFQATLCQRADCRWAPERLRAEHPFLAGVSVDDAKATVKQWLDNAAAATVSAPAVTV